MLARHFAFNADIAPAAAVSALTAAPKARSDGGGLVATMAGLRPLGAGALLFDASINTAAERAAAKAQLDVVGIVARGTA